METPFTNGDGETLAQRLAEARLAAGLSTREAAAKLEEKNRVSHATIANYESGRSSPPMGVLASLAALYGRPILWFLRSAPALTGTRYRHKKSKLRKSDLEWFEANAARLLEGYSRLEAKLGHPLRKSLGLAPKVNEGAAQFAQRVRAELKHQDADPVPSVVQVLEAFGIRIVELPTALPIDGLAASFGAESVVVLNPNTSNDRCRMILGHELGHIAYADCQRERGGDEKQVEERAFEFGSHLLLPDSQLREAFRGQSMVRLLQFKERFGISMGAMVLRAQRSAIIKDTVAKWLWIEFTKRGWRTKEPGYVRPDRATRFEQLVEEAIAQERWSYAEVGEVTGMREEELRERLRLALGCLAEEPEGGDDAEEGDVLPFPR